jgi:Xaa-Pro aminopeptidase
MFEKEIYIERRSALKASMESGLLLFLGNSESPMNFEDNTYHFRQDSTFLYYFGIDTPGLSATIDLDEGTTVLYGDEMTLDEIVWMGKKKSLLEKSLASGLTLVKASADLEWDLEGPLKLNRVVHFIPPYRADNKIKLSTLLNIPIPLLKTQSSASFIKAIVAQRSIKKAEEILEIHKAVSQSADLHLMAMKMVRPGMYEREIVAAIHEFALASGGQLSYPPIVTVEGEILHNHYYGNLLKGGQMVLNDSGIETNMGYAGDLTRTVPVNKRFSSRQKDVYDVVLNAYHVAVQSLGVNVKYLDVHLSACKTLVSGLKDLGLMKGNIEDAVSEGAHAMFFQCGTGHMMGLDVHDMEDLGEDYVGYTSEIKKNKTQFGLKSLRLGKPLEAGYVLTIEPGIYLIPELIDRWRGSNAFSEYINYDTLEAYRDFSGIRVEDNFLITEEGSTLLGKPLAITTTEIEDLRSEAF